MYLGATPRAVRWMPARHEYESDPKVRARVRRAVAHHEGSHAVVASLFGIRVAHASIRSDADRSSVAEEGVRRGHTAWEECTDGWSDASRSVTYLAGPIGAERSDPGLDLGDWDADYQQSHREVLEGHPDLGVKYTRGVLRGAEAYANELINEPRVWARIEQVAAALLEHDTLSGRQVRSIVGNLRVEMVSTGFRSSGARTVEFTLVESPSAAQAAAPTRWWQRSTPK